MATCLRLRVAEQGLRESGLKSGELVGLMVGCSVEGCIGILGIVLAGAHVFPWTSLPIGTASQTSKGEAAPCSQTVDSKGPHSLAAKDSAAWLKRTYPEVVAMEIEVSAILAT